MRGLYKTLFDWESAKRLDKESLLLSMHKIYWYLILIEVYPFDWNYDLPHPLQNFDQNLLIFIDIILGLVIVLLGRVRK